MGRASTIAGGRDLTVAAPLDELPVFARAGSIVALLPSDVDTLADNGSGPGLVHLRDRRTQLRLLVFPRGSSVRAVAPGVRVRSRERRGGWLLGLRSRRRHRLRIEASLATLRRPFRPCSVRLGRRRLHRRSWHYNSRSRVLNVRVKLRSGRLTVRRCPRH
jgi:hypothetical protein